MTFVPRGDQLGCGDTKKDEERGGGGNRAKNLLLHFLPLQSPADFSIREKKMKKGRSVERERERERERKKGLEISPLCV